MNKINLALATSLLAVSGLASASNIGCGLGTQVIGETDSVLMQALAVTTNGTSGNQTFGITSGTLGCAKPATFVSNELNLFVGENMDMVAQDMSQGQGEALDTLAELMGVGTTDKEAFFATLQRNFDQIFTSEALTSAQMIDNMMAVLG